MKKTFLLTLVLAFAVSVSSYAQPRAIGLNVGYGIDLSYQHTIGEKNMIDMTLSLPGFIGISAQATYDWINPFSTQIPWDYKGKWDWEMGAGAGVGYVWHWRGLLAGAAGHVGVSYDFWFPLQLSVDWRPLFGIYTYSNDDYYVDSDKHSGVGFWAQGLAAVTVGVRYRF